jgi:hypothetical protein
MRGATVRSVLVSKEVSAATGVKCGRGGVSVPSKRTKEAIAQETATKVAEGIGEALAGIVNRLESLEAERENVYKQLLGLQKRFNTQVTRFGEAIGQRMTGATSGHGAGRSPRKVRRTAEIRVSTRKTATPRSRKKAPITCGICGTSGHNARGHTKWKASQGE